MQIYRGMDIGTGKILPAERTVPYWGLDLAEPGEPYSAALFQGYARAAFEDVDARGKRSVLCGGTGLYVRAAIDDYRFPKGEQVDNEVRDRYAALARDIGNQALWERLRAADPDSAALIHPNNVRRVIRAFELLDEGTTYARVNAGLKTMAQAVPAVFLGLSVDPAVLNARIDARVDQMLADGLVEEVRSLLRAGFREGLTAPQAIGYKEVVAALEGACSLDDAVAQIKIATHRYAKRQRTWFRKDERIRWIDANDANVEEMTRQALGIIASAERA
ncbi:MAG TPA: tRNA (adenosine(37)-N6)-dimethylallyltransferase MiaA, partial [Candidatus Aveggerthella excrementigallinarum]|nr:tRNA (adenosine(37)-N6)-dimethylallyltransferase MiaA [Candidatus Aveggerthella excrementigallinarum]